MAKPTLPVSQMRAPSDRQKMLIHYQCVALEIADECVQEFGGLEFGGMGSVIYQAAVRLECLLSDLEQAAFPRTRH